MKICWDNLENIYLTKTGIFRNKINGCKFIYKEKCKNCGESFLSQPQLVGNFCSPKCNNSGNNNGRYKGGYRKKGIPRYDLYKRLNKYEKIRRDPEDKNILQVSCCVCDVYFTPKLSVAVDRLDTIEKGNRKTYNFYCSDDCKNECNIYNKKIHIKGYEPEYGYPTGWNIIRENIKKRDGYECKNPFCINKIDDLYHITAHHIDYDRENIEEKNLITLCRSCNSSANSDKEWHMCFYKEIIRRIYNKE